MIDIETLRAMLRYEPETGKLFWRPQPAGTFKTPRYDNAWRTRCAGKEAFKHVDREGYLYGAVRGRTFRAHRVAWAIYYGQWPSKSIDHINRICSDNRIENLREATGSQNQWNTRGRVGTSKFKGIYRNPKGRWIAQIAISGVVRHIGVYSDEVEAARAYDAAALRERGEFAGLNFPT